MNLPRTLCCSEPNPQVLSNPRLQAQPGLSTCGQCPPPSSEGHSLPDVGSSKRERQLEANIQNGHMTMIGLEGSKFQASSLETRFLVFFIVCTEVQCTGLLLVPHCFKLQCVCGFSVFGMCPISPATRWSQVVSLTPSATNSAQDKGDSDRLTLDSHVQSDYLGSCIFRQKKIK